LIAERFDPPPARDRSSPQISALFGPRGRAGPT
jgi:hypothetical protein